MNNDETIGDKTEPTVTVETTPHLLQVFIERLADEDGHKMIGEYVMYRGRKIGLSVIQLTEGVVVEDANK